MIDIKIELHCDIQNCLVIMGNAMNIADMLALSDASDEDIEESKQCIVAIADELQSMLAVRNNNRQVYPSIN